VEKINATLLEGGIEGEEIKIVSWFDKLTTGQGGPEIKIPHRPSERDDKSSALQANEFTH
jgi:hypothetical protein